MKIKKIINLLIIFIIIGALLSGFFLYFRLNNPNNNFQNVKNKDVKEVLTKVSKIYLFPGDEEPTVAFVSDPQKLKEQSFFSDPEVGDRVLIFIKSGKAILYRPSINKIIEIVSVKNN